MVGDPIWCRTCREHIRAGLHRLPDLAAAACIRDDGRLPHLPPSVHRRASRTGSPSGSPAYDTADEIIHWACAWEEIGRRELSNAGWDLPRGARLPSWNALRGRALTRASAFLAGWHVQLLAHPDIGHDLGSETIALVTTLEKVTGHDDTITRLHAPCRRCDRVKLRRRDGTERVECANCHETMTMDEYEQWAKMGAHAFEHQAG